MIEKIKVVNYCAIRKDMFNDHEFIDVETMSGDIEYCRIKAQRLNNKCIHWGENNPIVRIARIELVEVTPTID